MADARDEARAEALSEELGEDSGEATFECESCGRVLPYDCAAENHPTEADLCCEDCHPDWP